MARLLLVDENAKKLNILNTLLQAEGFKIVPVVGLEKSRSFIKTHPFDLAVVDISSDPDQGMDLLVFFREIRPDLPVIAIRDGNCPEPPDVVSRMDLLSWADKPLNLKEFIQNVHKMVNYQCCKGKTSAGVENLVVSIDAGSSGIVAISSAMRSICNIIKRIAPTNVSVIIFGEDGLEKEDVARAIHECSLHNQAEFVRFDCGARLSEAQLTAELFESSADSEPSLFEKSNGGTLYLENIEALPLNLQTTLYNILKQKKIINQKDGKEISLKIRTIASMCENPEKSIQAGVLNADLYKMLNLISVNITPLRERKEDIAPLAKQALMMISQTTGGSLSFDDDIFRILERYPWPGNTNELREVIRSAAKRAENSVITRATLPPEVIVAFGARL